jgi:HSP20 family protein
MVGYWEEMLALERRVDELMRSFLGTRTTPTPKAFMPTTDVFDRKGDLVVRVELPGVDAGKDVKVSVEEGSLVIAGERRQHGEIREDAYYRMETSYGAFTRRVPLPEGIDEDTITAEYKDGVLEVVVPKAAARIEAPEVKEIPVRTMKPVKAA